MVTAVQEMTLEGFAEELASQAPVPGGGGAGAIVAALGAALAGMVCSFTVGKKKYADWEEEVRVIALRAKELQRQLLALAQADADAFAPLSHAYSIAKEDPTRDAVMEECLRGAAMPPMEILRLCCETIELHEQLLEKGSRMLLSDVGTGAALCRGALYGAALNVRANTKLMTDGDYAAALNEEVEQRLERYGALAEELCQKVYQGLGRG